MSGGLSSLELSVAVELASAWVSRLARQLGIRALVIKGEATSRHGLRAYRTSGDVDLLVDPSQVDLLSDALVHSGWAPRWQTLIGEEWSPHSTTFIHPNWPCDIDVHQFFPGMLAQSDRSFEELWRGRQVMLFANKPVEVPDRAGSAIILALHSLRDGKSQERQRHELLVLLQSTLSDAELVDIAELARRVGAVETLDGVFDARGIEISASYPPVEEAALKNWRSRVKADSSKAFFWLQKFRGSTLKQKPLIVFRAVWPSRRDLITADPWMADTARRRLLARLERIPRGLRSLPAAWAAIHTVYFQSGRDSRRS